MKITWLAHAAFLIEGDGLRIITDHYNPQRMGFAPITEPADIVIRSSADDGGHCHAEMIRGNPTVVTATEIIESGTTVKNLHDTAVFAQKSLIYKETPLDNAVHRFTVEGIQMAHMGDAGNRLTDEQIDGLLGGDILLALAEGPPTLEIPDLWDAIQMLQPRIVIPMHFHLPGINGTFLDVEPLAARFSPGAVRRVDGPSVALTDATLPAAMQRIILKSSIAQ